MSIKKEIDRAVKRTAALNGKTMPKTPAEQDQIVFEVDEAFRNSAFDFNNAMIQLFGQIYYCTHSITSRFLRSFWNGSKQL